MTEHRVQLDAATGGVILTGDQTRSIQLHPLWLRERVQDADSYDDFSNQRLYEHADIDLGIQITAADIQTPDHVTLQFSDGHVSDINLTKISRELGWQSDPEKLPVPKIWNAELTTRPEAHWDDLERSGPLKTLLDGYFRYGFCIIHGTPTDRRNCLENIAAKFGYVRDTNFGRIFHVETKPRASDMAYTDKALLSHTDNPYRQPVPGIQFLHCMRNEVAGGLSTLVDGMALARQLERENPESYESLCTTPVRFRYEGPSAILENTGPLIERDDKGMVKRTRLSSRVDYVPALDPKTLSLFYAGRQRLHQLSNDPAFQISFPFEQGLLLMMDNYRVLHGRTAFDGLTGHRHLQGCYIDHDGVESLYRMIARDGKTVAVKREMA